jgi:hypothetical protein
MAIRTELSLRLPNSPGALAKVCNALASARVNLVALHLEGSGRLRLIVDNPLSGAGALHDHEYQVEQHDVLYAVVPNTPGALAGIARLIAEGGVNIDYAYASALEGGAMSAVVFGVADAQRAATAAGL